MQYLSLLRGINVGSNSLVKMDALKAALTTAGMQNVRTYIQSGNVFFISENGDKARLAQKIEACVKDTFGISAGVAVFSKDEWQKILDAAPAWWGKRDNWKHNLFVLIGAYDMSQVVTAVGALNPEIEAMESGDGVLYQSMSMKLLGRTTTGKLASNPIYKQMTVRNYNTAIKLLELFE